MDAFDRRAELLRTLEFVDRAIGAAIGDDPVKLAPLIRERRELIAELGPVEVVEEVDPFDEFLAGEGNVVRFDSAKGREAS
ncbi:Hypotetical protein [Gulosibacter molinativorax]|nr:Hypotetical protein [Gulosibacter molinativorax]